MMVRSHPDCSLHRPAAGHPEAPARLAAVLDALRDPPHDAWVVEAEAELPRLEDVLGMLTWVHDGAYIERVREAAERGSGALDGDDCMVSAGTFTAAMAASALALGSALDLVNGRQRRVFLAARPPSHHAERDRARGYCFFNGVALAAEVIVQAWGSPVLIVDIDAHHGNGTQRQFYDRADVGYVSVHAYPGFPGTGTADEIGEGRGAGTTRNVPLAADADDELVCAALDHAIEEVGSLLRPSAIVVSAGFDGHAEDPVGGLKVTGDGFGRLTRTIVQASETWAGGRILSILEGGFQPRVVAESARIHVSEMAGVGRIN